MLTTRETALRAHPELRDLGPLGSVLYNRVMSVYVRDGVRKSHFDEAAFGRWDAHARSVFSMFFQSRTPSWQVYNNDNSVKGQTDYDSTDIRIVGPNGHPFNLEVETKLSGFTDYYLKQGVHVPWRKIQKAFEIKKYNPSNFLIGMTNKDGNQILLIKGHYAYLAHLLWPDSSESNPARLPDFKKPEHGCFPIEKETYRDRSKSEDFCSIHYDRITRYSKINGVWRVTKKSDGKFMGDN